MPAPTNCLECNAPLGPTDAGGVCPKCLLKLGLASQLATGSLPAIARGLRENGSIEEPFDFGRYRIHRLLGKGGMGAVYEAEQLDTGRRIALKVLGQTIDSPEMRKRFLREGRLAASLNHPNSVFIFGTEEIESAPVISMELVSGGTLKDEIKRRGPLPVRDAVDAILQVIAGLEAAARAGVLHRDVKPANCFVAPDGTIKVGDFGLSVSTTARNDSQLTASGMMLGTPAFAPPEQLRGDDLDARADIYSAGATLYALLAGRPPFSGDNAVHVVAAVLDKPPEPLAKIRPDVPPSLASLISRCLAKKPDARFENYAELREALIPFSSQAAEQAPLGLRFVAGLIDEGVSTLPAFAWMIIGESAPVTRWLQNSTAEALIAVILYLVARIAYYGVCEGVWGAGLGKMLCGLRVVRPGHGSPGLFRATARVFIYFTSEFVGHAGDAVVASASSGRWAPSDWSWILFLSLFATMRRRNGMGAIHDLLTGTRVVMRAKSPTRPRSPTSTTVIPPAEHERLGPFALDGSLPSTGWCNAYDELLRRHVWIRRSSAESAPVSEVRRGVARPGRLRWLAGGWDDIHSGWDAFEAPPGVALNELPEHSRPWSEVRHWLSDLTVEIDAAMKDGTLVPRVGLEHVWLTEGGRAVLLDEPLVPGQRVHFDVATSEGLQQFLQAVSRRALDPTTVPLHARNFLQRLSTGAFDRASFIAGNLQSLVGKPAVLTRRRRLASLLLAPSIILSLCAVAAYLMIQPWTAGELEFQRLNPEQRLLPAALRYYGIVTGEPMGVFPSPENPDPETIKAAGQWISWRYGAFIQNSDFDERTKHLGARERMVARGIVQQFPSVTPEEFSEADAAVGPLIRAIDRHAHLGVSRFSFSFLIVSLSTIAIANLLSVTFFGTSLGLRLFGLAVVDQTGAPVSRLRHLVRNVFGLLPLALLIPGLVVMARLADGPAALPSTSIGFALSVLFGALSLVGGIAAASLQPQRGWHDRLARTRLVLR